MSTRGQGRGTRTRPQQRGSDNSPQPTRSQRMLLRRVQDLPQEFQNAILERRVRMMDTTEYVTKIINDSSVTDLIETQTKKILGISSIDNNFLGGNKAMIVERIKISVPVGIPQPLVSGSLPPLNSPEILKFMYFTNSNLTQFSFMLSNAEFILTLNDTVVYTNLVERFLRDVASGSSHTNKEDGLALDAPIFINSSTVLKAEIRIPESVTMSNFAGLATQTPVRAVKLQFIGQGLRIVSAKV